MDAKDIQLTRLTRNMRNFADAVSAQTLEQANRQIQAVSNARKKAQEANSTPHKGAKCGRAAVVAWDLGHNPVGRAYVLCQLLQKDWDVELIGPMWSRYGDSLWEPLRNTDLKIHGFQCKDFEAFIPKAEALAAMRTYDIVYVCKPRLPSLYLGALIKDSSDCPLVLDVDDFELSFFKDESSATLDDLKAHIGTALHEPFEELGTRYAQSLIPAADALTVSNVALRNKFGGHIVRHARDEEEFCNTAEKRQAARSKLNIADSDYALMFIGTPRPHKGVLEVARALHVIADPNIVFHIVGTITDQAVRNGLAQYDQARIVCHDNCAFADLPNLLAGADLVPLIQDVNHAISQYQIPAKVSDALSLGVPVLATNTPPLADLIAAGAITATEPDQLAASIVAMKSQASASSTTLAARRQFLNELSLSVNRARLSHAILEASETCTAMQAESAIDEQVEPPRLPPAYREFVDLFREHYRELRNADMQATIAAGSKLTDAVIESPGKSKLGGFGNLFSIGKKQSKTYNIAFFWKQNDTGLYGRRSDMIAKYLIASGRVDRMVHFNAPMSAPLLERHFSVNDIEINGQEDLILRNLVDRQMGVHDTAIMRSRTYLASGQKNRGRFVGEKIAKKETYVRYVHTQLEQAGMRPDNTIAWFCPVIWEARELINSLGFAGIVSDLIDDQRGWETSKAQTSKLEASYRHTLAASDLVFANCESLADTMRPFANNIHVVANGAERFAELPPMDRPESLKNISGPIAGYVGNLRDRIDWLLLQEVVTKLPDVSFVFYGPSSNNANADSLAKHANVHMLGVVPYADLARHLRAFDVALVPHINNRLTEHMNPLKVYNYYAAGLPIVSSDVSNLENVGEILQTAANPAEFSNAVRQAINKRIDTSTTEWQDTMNTIAWDTRVENILSVMDQQLHSRLRKSA
ncbi:MAG: glycosyltransferase [Granulosicoccus sp.]